MDHHAVIEIVAAVCLIATGVSHVVAHGAWATLFRRWSEGGESGALINGLLHAGVGGLFLVSHPVFTGYASVLTYWAALVLTKGLVCLVAPGIGLRSLRALTPERAGRLRWVGMPMVALGVVIGSAAFV